MRIETYDTHEECYTVVRKRGHSENISHVCSRDEDGVSKLKRGI
jgi:hypothetical protein